MEPLSLIELVTSLVSLAAAVMVLLAALAGLSAINDWRRKWQIEADRLEFIYRCAFTPEEFEAFEEQVQKARDKAEGRFSTFVNSLQSRIDRRKVRL